MVHLGVQVDPDFQSPEVDRINNYDRYVTNWIYNISPCNTIV